METGLSERDPCSRALNLKKGETLGPPINRIRIPGCMSVKCNYNQDRILGCMSVKCSYNQEVYGLLFTNCSFF